MNHFSYRNNSLTAESLELRNVAEQFGTPLYVYSTHAVIDRCRHIEEAFDGADHVTYYAVKANSNRALLRIIAQAGLGADVGSKGELYLSLAAGFAPDKITFSGVGKREDEIAYALSHDIHAFHVESPEEIQLLDAVAGTMGKRARFLLRVNLDIAAGAHAYISTSTKQNKFGVSFEQAAQLLRWSQELPHLEVRGIHNHLGSQIVDSDIFRQAAHRLLDLVGQLRGQGIPVQELDFGGGFGVQYRGFLTHPLLPYEEPEANDLSTAGILRAVLPILRRTDCLLSIQPGRSIMAQSGVLLVRVLYRKVTEAKVFVVVDGGMNDLIRPSLYNAYHQIVPLAARPDPFEKVDVVGPCCESGDFFALDRVLPRVQRGDYLALLCAGAYGFVLSSNYNARLRPAEVLINDSQCTIIRERETLEQL